MRARFLALAIPSAFPPKSKGARTRSLGGRHGQVLGSADPHAPVRTGVHLCGLPPRHQRKLPFSMCLCRRKGYVRIGGGVYNRMTGEPAETAKGGKSGGLRGGAYGSLETFFPFLPCE